MEQLLHDIGHMGFKTGECGAAMVCIHDFVLLS